MSRSRSCAASVRRYLSEAGEKEALRVLREQLHRQRRVTSDDVRLAVRAVASQGGTVPVPSDFPPTRWVLEFKRIHGFVQFNSFAFGAAASGGVKEVFGLPTRLEVPPLRSAAPLSVVTGRTTSSERESNSQTSSNGKRSSNARGSVAQVTSSSLSSGNSSDDEKEPSEDRRSSSLEIVAAAATDLRLDSEAQRQMQLQHGFSQRHRQFLQQQQRRAMLVEERRQNVVTWPTSETVGHGEMRSIASYDSLESENGIGPGSDDRRVSSLPSYILHRVGNNGSVTDDMQSNASSNNDKRGYKLSHTVPAETWEKAIAAVEQQGMSLRAAAKMFGVHFAALHRRVKKRARGGLAKGNNGYFHPSDEAGIMRVVVARAELGVLMTFDELMRLVEAAALRKLPDISVDSARNLLTRFQSRNEQSVRRIIVDWPPSRARTETSTSSGDGGKPYYQPYLEHPGFRFGPKASVILRSVSAGGGSTQAPSAATMAAAAKTTLFVPPSRVGPLSTSTSSQVNRVRARIMNDNGLARTNGILAGASNDRLLCGGSRARMEGDGDAVMVV